MNSVFVLFKGFRLFTQIGSLRINLTHDMMREILVHYYKPAVIMQTLDFCVTQALFYDAPHRFNQ